MTLGKINLYLSRFHNHYPRYTCGFPEGFETDRKKLLLFYVKLEGW